MHNTQAKKTAFLCTVPNDNRKLLQMEFNGCKPLCQLYIEMVVFIVTIAFKRVCTVSNQRVVKAITTTKHITVASIHPARKPSTVTSETLPSAAHGTQLSRPSLAIENRIRFGIMRCIWGCASLSRCKEIVLSLLHDPTKVDPYIYYAYRAIPDTRRMLCKSDARAAVP